MHTRYWLVDEEKIVIKDKVTGIIDSAVARFIMHGDVTINKVDAQTFVLVAPNNIVLTFRVICGTVKVVDWQYTSTFGFLSDTSCIEINLVDGECSVEII